MRCIDLYIDDIRETSSVKDEIVINVITNDVLNQDEMNEVERLIRNNYRELF